MRVLIDSRLSPGVDGGVQQVIEGLAYGFGKSASPSSEFTFLTRTPWLDANNGSVRTRQPGGRPGLARRVARAMPGATALRRQLRARSASVLGACPIDDREYDCVHLAIQHGFRTTRPFVYSPYDLQHLHFPEFFPPALRDIRRSVYDPLARDAAAVVMHTPWNAADIAEQFGLDEEKVYCIPLAVSPAPHKKPPRARKLLLEVGITQEQFALYPAQTWPHKNHLRLLRAVAKLRDAGTEVPVVCTGARTDHFGAIEAEIDRLDLSELVKFPGFVDPHTLQAAFAQARVLVFPSLFEGWGMPVFDALARGLPVACTNSCGFGDLVGDAALLLDPFDEDSIADALAKVWTAGGGAQPRIDAGRRLTEGLTWERTCRTLEAVYRRVAGLAPEGDDVETLARAKSWRMAG